MKKLFQSVQRAKVPRANFNLSHEVKLTADIGQLYPVLTEEVVPGDKWNIDSEVFVRLMPLLAPLMHRLNVYIHYFYVPNRIIWSGWEDFITGESATTVPDIALSYAYSPEGSLADYLGVPELPAGSGTQTISQLPFRAYWKVWNEYYRDQNFETEVNVEALGTNQYRYTGFRSWEKDYFTSALPWAQKGADVTVPMKDISYLEQATWEAVSGTKSGKFEVDTSVSNDLYLNSPGFVGTSDVEIQNVDSVNIDINDLRTAHRVQRWLEKNARAGSRYVEHLLAHFGVISSDKRLDRPEYLGGGKTPIVISEVLNTSDTTNAVQGEMTGHGISVGNTNRASYFVEEHGWILGIMSIIPKAGYHQGLHKKFSRSVATDFYFPEFARLGEQEVKMKELYAQGTAGGDDDDETFGYQARYAEYKYAADRIHGEFKDTMDFWHMNRVFGSKPALNVNFTSLNIESLPLQARVFAAGSVRDSFAVQIYHKIIASRPMPYYADPTL